jgi:DNA-binding HxlR family transcriptional regulator
MSMIREVGVSPGRPDSGQVVYLPRSERRLVEQIERALELLQGKWKVPLLFLMARGVHRHCKLLEGLRAASKKMMTETLRALERDGLVRREIFAEVPLRVEYSLTPLGWAMTEPLMALADWDESHREEVECARLRYRAGDDRTAEGRRELEDPLVHRPGEIRYLGGSFDARHPSAASEARSLPAEPPVSRPRSVRARKLVTPPRSAVAERPMLVVFLSARSGSSRRAEGFLANILQRRQNHETFRLVRVDANERPDLVERLHVAEVPALVVVTNGRVRGRLSKPRGCAEIRQLLSPWLR